MWILEGKCITGEPMSDKKSNQGFKVLQVRFKLLYI